MIHGKKIGLCLSSGWQKAIEALPRIRELLGISGPEPGTG